MTTLTAMHVWMMSTCQALKTWQVYQANRLSKILKPLFVLVFFIVSVSPAYSIPLILDIDASSDDGTKIGTFIGTTVKKKFPDLEKQYDHYLTFLLSPNQFKQLIPQVKNLKKLIDPAYQAEIKAIAAVWQLNAQDKLGDGKLSQDEFWLLQLLPDLTDINKGSGLAVTNRRTQNPIAARNLDWKNAADLKNLQTISVYHYPDRTLVNIGFAGLVNVLSGFNDKGLFASLLDASEMQVANLAKPQASSGFELRNTLKHYNSIALAVQSLAQKTYPRSHQILLADPQDIGVLEQPAGKMGKLRQTNSMTMNNRAGDNLPQMAVTDCFALVDSPHNCYTSKAHYRLGRFAQLMKKTSSQTLSVNNIVTVMQDHANSRQAIFNQETLQSLIFTPKNRVLYFSTPGLTNSHKKTALEKYQFIKPRADNSNEIILILLGFIGLGLGLWASYALWRKKYSAKET